MESIDLVNGIDKGIKHLPSPHENTFNAVFSEKIFVTVESHDLSLIFIDNLYTIFIDIYRGYKMTKIQNLYVNTYINVFCSRSMFTE